MLTRELGAAGVATLILLSTLVGCTDETGGTAADDGAVDGASQPAVDMMTSPDAVADAERPADAASPDMTPDIGAVDAAPPECEPGARMCVEGGAVPARAECGPNGRWAIVACAEGEVCLGDGFCVPDPAECVEGQRTCLGPDQPAVCAEGEGWVEQSPCLPGWTCSGNGRCRSPQCGDASSRRSYLGCDFWATDLPNTAYAIGSTPDAPMGLVLANPDVDRTTRVWVRTPDGQPAPLIGEVTIAPPLVAAGTPAVTVFSELRGPANELVEQGFELADPVDIPVGGMAVLLLPHHPYNEASLIRADSWRIETDRPVAAYQFSPYCCNYSFTNDASLLLPIPALGSEYLYVGVPGWSDPGEEPDDPGQAGNGPIDIPATLSVLGTVNGTDVRVELPPGVSVPTDLAGRIQRNGQQVTARIDAGEVLTLVTPEAEQRPGRPPIGVDLSGARISASEPVAAFSGHICTFYPQDQSACDHLEEQLFPADTLGNRFVLAPTVLRTLTPELASEATFWKIVARDDNTRIRLSVPFDQLDASDPGFVGVPSCRSALEDPETLTLNRGEFCEFGTRAPLAVTSDRPISVMGIISGQSSTGLFAGAGDPAIFLLPPEYQYRRDYAFLAPTTYRTDYVTVVAPAGATIELDGAPLDMAAAIPVPGSTQVYEHFEIADGAHRLVGDQPFGILVYAYDDYVSYAFTGGQNLIKR